MTIDNQQIKALDDLRAQRAALESKIKADEANLRAGVITQLRKHIADYGITQQQLFGGGAGPRTTAKAGKSVPKYRDPAGNTWSGGRGRVPEWVKAIRASGGDIEKFKI